MEDIKISVVDRYPDVEAEITLNKIKGRPVISGYRPGHRIKDDYITTGIHRYIHDVLRPGETATGMITFITPEAYPRTLWIGKKLDILEGDRVVGVAKITKIYNSNLDINNRIE
jgi:elongation factor Tu